MSGLTRLHRPQSAGTTPQLPHFMQTRPKPGGCSSPFRGDFSQHEPQVWQGSDHGHPSPAFWAIACPGSKATVMQPFLSWGNCISQQVQSAHQMNIFVLHHWSILPNAEVCGRNWISRQSGGNGPRDLGKLLLGSGKNFNKNRKSLWDICPKAIWRHGDLEYANDSRNGFAAMKFQLYLLFCFFHLLMCVPPPGTRFLFDLRK